jgi:hypothetical protein
LDVSVSGGYGIIALSAELRSVYGNSLHRILEVFAEVLEVLCGSGDAVQPNDHCGWFRAIEGEPFSERKISLVKRRIGTRGEMGLRGLEWLLL